MTLGPSNDDCDTFKWDKGERDSVYFCKRLVLLGHLRKVESKYLVSTSSVVSFRNLTKMSIYSSSRMVFRLWL